MKIRILDKKLANMISAGEVVEKPASVVKELVENSIDAGATRIVIGIIDGGIQQIEIADNGCGIEPEDLPLAFKPHATSKITSSEDLFAIATLGFRGEALASIAAVSEVEITTKTQGSELATKLKISGGDVLETSQTAAQTGTRIVVQNLFFNTPARKKFLNKPKIEEKDVTKIVERFMLSYPHIKFQYKVNGELIYNTLGTGLYDNIYLIYGKEVADKLVKVHFSNGKYTLEGYTSMTTLTKPNRSFQVSFLNGRMVKDIYMENAIQFAYQDYLMSGNFPVCFLNLKVPFDTVDVNIHPSKQEVKYENVREINIFFIDALKRTLENTQSKKVTEMFKPNYQTLSVQDKLNEFKAQMAKLSKEYGTSYQKTEDMALNACAAPLQNVNLAKPKALQGSFSKSDKEYFTNFKPKPLQQALQMEIEGAKDQNPYKIIGVLFQTYILLEVGDKLILIDQHACHERKLFDKFMAEVEAQTFSTQPLLCPYTFSCSTEEAKFFNQHQEDFASIGIVLEEFGQNVFRVMEVPFLIRDMEYGDFFAEIKANINRINFSKSLLNKDFLAQAACKSAVKAGDKLSDKEIRALLADLENTEKLTCPHGRPFVHTISKRDLEKWFKRIV